MRVVLFRRIMVNGVNYYQLFQENDNYKENDFIGNYEKRDEYDCFYIDKDSDIIIPDESLYNIYYSDGDKLKVVDSFELYDRISQAFNDKFHYFTKKREEYDDVIQNIRKKVLFQDASITTLVKQLYLNQDIVNSNLPVELKANQKKNIIFHGKVGCGKKSIIDALENEIDIPYADIVISPDVKDTLERIIKELFEKAKTGEEASNGIVFVRDNYNDLMELLEDKFYSYLDFLTTQGMINYQGKIIDLRTVTFVFLHDDYLDNSEDLNVFQNMSNCSCSIETRDLSIKDKFLILFSPNGRLNYYEKFLNSKGHKLIVDNRSLLKIIIKCSTLDSNMNVLNSIIDGIIKISIINEIKDVYIDEDVVKTVSKLIDTQLSDDMAKIEENETEDFWFEKKVDAIVEKAKEHVVGQDKALKVFVRQLVSNIRWANKEGVERPKNYIKNILLRGNTGTGKTFIPETVLKDLGVPYTIANATEYTEAGYVGKDVEDMLVDLYHAADDDLEKAKRGILVIDEIDKIASKTNGSVRDVGGGGVQEALYKFAEGTIIKINLGNKVNEIPVYFDTSRLTIIGGGAFEGIEEIRDERIGKRKTGFGAQSGNGKDPNITIEDYILFGMRKQFMRRIKEVINLNDVTKEQLINIMKNSQSSALKIEQNTLEDQGIELEFADNFYEPLAEKALAMDQGVTGIEKALHVVFQSINLEDIRASEVEKIILTGEVINNPDKVIIIPRSKQKIKKK